MVFKQRQNTKSRKLKIPPSHAKKALDNLQRCLEDEARQKLVDDNLDIERNDEMIE
jgi:hypothetical protein